MFCLFISFDWFNNENLIITVVVLYLRTGVIIPISKLGLTAVYDNPNLARKREQTFCVALREQRCNTHRKNSNLLHLWLNDEWMRCKSVLVIKAIYYIIQLCFTSHRVGRQHKIWKCHICLGLTSVLFSYLRSCKPFNIYSTSALVLVLELNMYTYLPLTAYMALKWSQCKSVKRCSFSNGHMRLATANLHKSPC